MRVAANDPETGGTLRSRGMIAGGKTSDPDVRERPAPSSAAPAAGPGESGGEQAAGVPAADCELSILH